MVVYGCACDKLYYGKNGQRRLDEHVAKKKTPKCSPRNRTYFSGKKSAEKQA